MNAKLMALAVVLLCLGTVVSMNGVQATVRVPSAVADGAFPRSVGAYQRVARRSIPEGPVIVEERADYAAAGLQPVSVGITTGRPNVHNGVRCHVARGETLVSERLMPVQTPGMRTVFDVAILRAATGLKLVANTECFGTRCNEEDYDGWTRGWRDLRTGTLSFRSAAVVPLAVTVSSGDSAQATAEALQTRFESFAAVFDLAPTRHLAALQERRDR